MAPLRQVTAVAVTSVLAAAGLVLTASPALAAAPSFDRETISFEFESGSLTEACGVPVTVSGEGSAINRSFAETGRQGVRYVRSVNVAVTFSSGDRSITLRDVGADVERVTPDGSRILLVVGQLPFDFHGSIQIDLETDEVLREPTRLTLEFDTARVCDALTG
jgi:hypothetical protein